jgi:hypothetical protein
VARQPEGLQQLGERSFERLREIDHNLEKSQMELSILHREREKFAEKRRLLRLGEETGTLDIIEPEIDELMTILNEIIELEKAQMELEEQSIVLTEKIMRMAEESEKAE